MLKTPQNLAVKVLLFSTFIVSVCGLSYELLIGSLATELLGNPILQYSLTIGFFMSALGLGSYLSRFIVKNLLHQFVVIEIALGLLGGVSVILLKLVSIRLSPIFTIVYIIALTVIGTLVGLEIPIITRILKQFGDLKETISNVLTIDYIGGLVASLIFPLVLYPYVGTDKTAFVIGFINVLIGIINLWIFSKDLMKKKTVLVWIASVIGLIILICGFIFSSALRDYHSNKIIPGTVLYEERSRFQKILIASENGNIYLRLDGYLQFYSAYEHRYHETLTFPPFFLKKNIKKVLVMGGGDGLAVRDILKFKSVEKVVLVDLDPAITGLAQTFPVLTELNRNALNDPRVEVVNQDAYTYLKTSPYHFDVIYADFPDPHEPVLSKLYSLEFYHFVKNRLQKNGIFITQASSPLHARFVYYCMKKTMNAVFKNVIPYYVNIRRLGDWGFLMATDEDINVKAVLEEQKTPIPAIWGNVPYKFFSREVFLKSLIFPKDCQLQEGEEVDINRFGEPNIYKYYLKAWKNW